MILNKKKVVKLTSAAIMMFHMQTLLIQIQQLNTIQKRTWGHRSVISDRHIWVPSKVAHKKIYITIYPYCAEERQSRRYGTWADSYWNWSWKLLATKSPETQIVGAETQMLTSFQTLWKAISAKVHGNHKQQLNEISSSNICSLVRRVKPRITKLWLQKCIQTHPKAKEFSNEYALLK